MVTGKNPEQVRAGNYENKRIRRSWQDKLEKIMPKQDEIILKNCFALTGSIGTGKSTVASILSQLGSHIVDTDLIARQVVEPGKPALEEIKKNFGDFAINPDGTLDRDSMRKIIMNDPEKRKILNSIIHPHINQETLKQIIHYNSLNDGMPIIIDVPLLFEAGWDKLFPRIILAYAPFEVQLERLIKRDSMDEDTARKNISSQINIEDKKKLSTYIIDNSGELQKTGFQVKELFEEIKGSL